MVSSVAVRGNCPPTKFLFRCFLFFPPSAPAALSRCLNRRRRVVPPRPRTRSPTFVSRLSSLSPFRPLSRPLSNHLRFSLSFARPLTRAISLPLYGQFRPAIITRVIPRGCLITARYRRHFAPPNGYSLFLCLPSHSREIHWNRAPRNVYDRSSPSWPLDPPRRTETSSPARAYAPTTFACPRFSP